MGVIVGLIVILIVIGALIAAFKLGLKVAKFLGIAAAGIYLAPAIALGYASFRLSRMLRISWLAQPMAVLALIILGLRFLALDETLWAVAFTASLLLTMGGMLHRIRAGRLAKSICWGSDARKLLNTVDLPVHLSLWFLATAFVARIGTEQIDTTLHTWLGWGYWLGAVAAQGFASFKLMDFRRVIRRLEKQVREHQGTPTATLVAGCKERASLLDDEIDELVLMHVASHVLGGRLVEINVGGRSLLYGLAWYTAQVDLLKCVLVQRSRFTDSEFEALTEHYLGLDAQEGLEHLSLQLHVGQRYQFEDGYFFVAYAADYEVQSCASCGMGRHVTRASHMAGEWFCSDLCRVTERTCIEIRKQAPESFIADNVSYGLTLLSSSDSWIRNHKLFAVGSQGHGPAAEHANTYIDRLLGKFAASVGGDNAQNGADRIVNGKKVQTKYCSTGGKSVGQAFGTDGRYRYWDGNKPMQLEVPRDQYDKALAAMRRKIKEGGMHPITDPDEAVNIIKKGHLTYEHAKNLTKFGTWESLTFDAAEGVIAGVGSAGIGFSITAGLVYIRTGDTKIAAQAAAIQAGKSGLTTAASYVGTQQLHRIELVQTALKHVDLSCIPPAVQRALIAGYGVESLNQLNHALRGNVVSAVVSIAVTSVPDVYRLIRREVTFAKLQRTVATAAGGVVGGTVGAVAGGAMGGAYGGPFGVWAGKLIGGTMGGLIGTAVIDSFFAEQKERERQAANALFRAHLEYLALGFSLSEEELRCVIKNFLRMSGENTHQRILAGKNKGRPYLNSVLRPLVVGVVKQRDCLRLEPSRATPLPEAA